MRPKPRRRSSLRATSRSWFFRFSAGCSSVRVSSCFSRTTGMSSDARYARCSHFCRSYLAWPFPRFPSSGKPDRRLAGRRRRRLSRGRAWRLHCPDRANVPTLRQFHRLHAGLDAPRPATRLSAGLHNCGHHLRGRDYDLGGRPSDRQRVNVLVLGALCPGAALLWDVTAGKSFLRPHLVALAGDRDRPAGSRLFPVRPLRIHTLARTFERALCLSLSGWLRLV